MALNLFSCYQSVKYTKVYCIQILFVEFQTYAKKSPQNLSLLPHIFLWNENVNHYNNLKQNNVWCTWLKQVDQSVKYLKLKAIPKENNKKLNNSDKLSILYMYLLVVFNWIYDVERMNPGGCWETEVFWSRGECIKEYKKLLFFKRKKICCAGENLKQKKKMHTLPLLLQVL